MALASERVNGLLGTELSSDEIVEILSRLDVEKRGEKEGVMIFGIPSFRNDLGLPEDLVEEVARIHGFDAIPTRAESAALISGSRPESWRVTTACGDVLRGEGFCEVQSFPFLDPADLDRLGLEPDDPRRQTLGIVNPINVDIRTEMDWLYRR